MYIESATIDDLLKQSVEWILKKPGQKITSKKGDNFDIAGVYLKLTNPLARLSSSLNKGTVFSTIGELMWYLKGSNELKFIKHYIDVYGKFSDDGRTLYGAYGTRLLGTDGHGINQFENIIKILSTKLNTRQAVIQILEPQDLLVSTEDLPCTISLQFLVREEKLHMFTSMRSNDMFKGFAHDVFSFTMLQEIIARILKLELGSYNHFVSSFHLYEEDIMKAKAYLKEGFQSTKYFMPEMPSKNICESIKTVLDTEELIRNKNEYDIESLILDEYWKDILRLVEAYSIYKNRKTATLEVTKAKLNIINNRIVNSCFKKYILEKALSLEHE